MAAIPRVIAHLDMDAFYASVELLRYPELRGQPVVIGGSRNAQPTWETDPVSGEARRRFRTLRGYTGRGVVTTATYEARALGVNSAMGMMKAAARAPDAVMLPADFDEYRKYSRLFKAAVRTIAPLIEDRGIDEIYIDLTPVVAARLAADARDDDDGTAAESITDAMPAGESNAPDAPTEAEAFWCARDIARAMKTAVLDATGLRCSVGLAPNKLIAKIASELDKPDGLALVTTHDIPTRIWPLPVRRINGVGPKAAAKLAKLGIETIGELAAVEPRVLRAIFGASYGAWLHAAAHGHDERPIVTESEPKSISRETTFERDLSAVRDRAELSRIFTWLAERVAADLVRKGYAARTIGIKLRFDDFRTVTRDLTLDAPTAEARAIRRAAGLCLKRIDLARRIRLLGVRAGALVHASGSDLIGAGAAFGDTRAASADLASSPPD
jgi:DNA polymerase-4